MNIHQTYETYGPDGSDVLGHGTAGAGVIAARANGFGIVGVAPGIRLWNIKVTGQPPNNSWSNLATGMDYVTQHSNEISIANISIVNSGLSAPFNAVQAAVRRMVNAGIVVVAAAGNDAHDLAGPDGVFGTGDDASPAAHPEVMAVSAPAPLADVFYTNSNFSRIPHRNSFVSSPGAAMDVGGRE